jgi:ABC-type phosphate transport system permease subunit
MREASEPRGRTWRAALRIVGAVAVAWMLAACPLPFALLPVVHAQNVPGKPIIVTIPPDKPKSELSGLADVLLGSLGLTGIIVIAAVLLGAVMAGVMFWVRSRQD